MRPDPMAIHMLHSRINCMTDEEIAILDRVAAGMLAARHTEYGGALNISDQLRKALRDSLVLLECYDIERGR